MKLHARIHLWAGKTPQGRTAPDTLSGVGALAMGLLALDGGLTGGFSQTGLSMELMQAKLAVLVEAG